MAEKATVAPADPWRAESDHGTLTRACEIMADRLRMKEVLKFHAKKRAGEKKLDRILAGHRSSGTLLSGY